jgi:hypothetical protein
VTPADVPVYRIAASHIEIIVEYGDNVQKVPSQRNPEEGIVNDDDRVG